jgi:FAD/FMN-containing dehydrogenase
MADPCDLCFVGGFITGGGGYSWLTNQYGLTGDTLISASLVLPNGTLAEASETVNSDLFWAIKGGGNQFGVIYSFRLKAFPRPAQVYGGLKIYAGSIQQSFLDAIAEFSANNKDPKAQIIPTTNTLAGVPLSILASRT